MLGSIEDAVEFDEDVAMELFNEESERLDELGEELEEEIALPEGWEWDSRGGLPEMTAWGTFPNPENDDAEEPGWGKDAIIAEAWSEDGNDSLYVYGFAHVEEVYAFVEKEAWGTNEATGEFYVEGEWGRFVEAVERLLNK